jgi:hypothetical protein
VLVAPLLILLILPEACTLISGVGSLHETDGSADGGAIALDAGDAPHRDGQTFDGGATLLFDEEFDGGALDTTTKWTVAGKGVWSIMGGHGVQSNPNVDTMLYAQGFTTATNYHIVARMWSTGPFDAGYDLAPEVVFRVVPSIDAGGLPEDYRCNMDLFYDQLYIQRQSGGTLGTKSFKLPMGFDLGTPFVLEAVVTGNSVTCTVTMDTLGVVATLKSTALTQLTGTFGLKTYHSSTEFQYFRVYALP